MDPTWSPPPQIDEFRLERKLGRGASAEVWLARDTLLDRAVALKIASHEANDEVRARFRMEARAISRLHHPNLLGVHHVGEIGTRPYLVTELLSGKSLAELDLPLEASRVVAIGIDLARGLAAVHRTGVLHRDIKPANAFLCEDGTAKLLDFGVAKVQGAPVEVSPAGADGAQSSASSLASTQTPSSDSGELAGTPLYMAPETWRGEAPTRRTDIYSLGALLFELLAGRAPVSATSLVRLHASVLAGAIEDLAAAAPSAPPALVALVLRCLQLAASERPSAEELCDAFALLAPPRATAPPDDPRSNPYRGLLAFGAEHRALFFGREAEAAAVLSELRSNPLVLVIGESGAGKSSLVRAAIVPRVASGAIDGGVSRQALVMIPGVRPQEMLAHVLAPVLGVEEEEVLRRLAESPGWLTQALVTLDARILLVVDQLEEIWTMTSAPERSAFLSALAELVHGGRTRILATLRNDFLDRLEDLGELRALALAAPIALGPLSPDGLRRAITEPAKRRGVTIEPALVEALAAHAGRGALPLLGFTLSALWDGREDGATSLGARALDALSGVSGPLAAHADAALARMPPAERSEARRLLLDLVTVERTRARREESELLGSAGETTRAALGTLVAARLVVASAGEHGAVYEVAHEALLAEWPVLRGWLDEEASSREALERLRRAAAEWRRLDRGVEALFGSRQLEEIEEIDARALSADAAAFVEASRAAVTRARLRRRALTFGIPCLVVSLGVAAWAVSHVRHRAAVARAIAEARSRDAKAEQTARLAEEARAAAIASFDKDDPGPGEDAWKRMRALEEDVDRERREAGEALDAALALDPRDSAARALFADVTLARFLAAERLHEDGLLRELRAQLDVYDDGTREARLRAPARVRVQTEPPGATLTLARYREDPAGRLLEADRAPLAAAGPREIEPGSYLVVAEAPGRYATRYPFLVRRGEERTLRIVLPRAADVPEGMIYVPAGRSLYGSSDDEATRGFLTHQPARDIDVGAFLMARTEVTNGDYVEFLRSLPEPEREARCGGGLVCSSDGHFAWKFHGKTLALGEEHCDGFQPCVDWARLPLDAASREDGERFAEWLSRSGRLPRARLCTDREWERAARGADDRQYPNGNGELGPADACTLATFGGEVRRAGPCAVGTHPATRSPFGVEDLSGSEWEWTSSSPDIAQPKQGLIRGAGWTDVGMYVSIPNRGLTAAAAPRYNNFGLRVCADLGESGK